MKLWLFEYILIITILIYLLYIVDWRCKNYFWQQQRSSLADKLSNVLIKGQQNSNHDSNFSTNFREFVTVDKLSNSNELRLDTCDRDAPAASRTTPAWCNFCKWRNNSQENFIVHRQGLINMKISHRFHVFLLSNESKNRVFTGGKEPLNITFGKEQYYHDHFDNLRDTNYLLFIVDNYYNLAEFVVFAHGHPTSWHQKENLSSILLKLDTKAKLFDSSKCPKGIYHPLSYEIWKRNRNPQKISSKCSSWPNPIIDNEWFNCVWAEYFEPEFPLKLLGCLISPCCGQFLVSRSRILRQPLSFWRKVLNYARTCFSQKGSPRDMFPESKCSANILEYTWHVLLGQEADYRTIKGPYQSLNLCLNKPSQQ